MKLLISIAIILVYIIATHEPVQRGDYTYWFLRDGKLRSKTIRCDGGSPGA